MDISKLLSGGAIFSILETMGVKTEDIAEKAKAGIINMIAEEEKAQGGNIFAIFSITPDKLHLLLSLYVQAPDGLKKYKDIDLSNPSQLLEIFTNDNKPNAGHVPTTATNAIEGPATDTGSDATANS